MSEIKIALDYLRIAVKSESITIKQISFWLNEYSSLYESKVNNYSCSTHEPKLPCFCENRKIDCLFIDLFREFKKLNRLIDKERELGNLVQEYYLLKENEIDLTNWFKNLSKINDDFEINKKGNFIRLNNGKDNSEYRNIIINLPKSEFINHNELSWIKNCGQQRI